MWKKKADPESDLRDICISCSFNFKIDSSVDDADLEAHLTAKVREFAATNKLMVDSVTRDSSGFISSIRAGWVKI